MTEKKKPTFFDGKPDLAVVSPAPRRRAQKPSPQLAVDAPYLGKAKLALDIDPRVKAEAQDTAAHLGISLTSVVTDLLRKWTFDNRPT